MHFDFYLEEVYIRDQELKAAFPALPDPQWTRVIAEKRATVACLPGTPPMPFEIGKGVLLAGDYLFPEYPPTLEAAVRSGIRAARRTMEKN